MTDRPHHLTTSRASQAWNDLAERVDALTAAWEADGEPPDLAAFLPDDPPELRKLVLVELIKVDLEFRWQTDDQRKRIEDYAREFRELATDGVPCDLIFEEYHIRRRADEGVTPEEYLERFPDEAEELRRLLHLDTSAASTTLAGRRRLPKIEVGDEVEDFDLLASLGEGAFGKVFLARQRSMQRLVALKISGDHGEEPQTLAQLDHPHIVRVYDQRKLEGRKLRLLYMQYVPGGTLQQVVRMRRSKGEEPLTGRDLVRVVDEALEARGIAPPVQSLSRTWLAVAPWWQVVAWLGVRLAKGLDSAHARGVLHRDVKPANVLLDADGEPKLADFNISFCSKLDGASADAFFGGSLPYMSPEQLEVCCPRYSRTADQIDAKSDLYSLGVVLWELLTGHLPHGEEVVRGAWSETLVEILRRRSTPVNEMETTAHLDPAARPLVGVLVACLAPQPADRPQSGGELARRLALCLTPDVQSLLSIEPDSWRHWVLSHPYLAIVTAGLAPNILSGFFNYKYNEGAIVRHLDDRSQALFANISTVINGIAFPLGAVIGIWLLRRLARGVARRDELPHEERQSLRGFALMFGLYVAVLGTVEWLIAGPIFPLCFHLLGGHVPPAGWLHFFASMTISGLIAAAYPYLLITVLGTRVYFPALLGTDAIEASDARLLARTAILSQVFLVTAAAIPMLSVTLAAFWGSGERFVLGTMSLVTTLGFLFAFWLYYNIQRDVRRLREITD